MSYLQLTVLLVLLNGMSRSSGRESRTYGRLTFPYSKLGLLLNWRLTVKNAESLKISVRSRMSGGEGQGAKDGACEDWGLFSPFPPAIPELVRWASQEWQT
jgi:hypothetical protein